MLFTASTVSSRWNGNSQEPETPANTLLHCLLVWGGSYCPSELLCCLVPKILICRFDANATFKEEIQQPRAKHANAQNLSANATI